MAIPSMTECGMLDDDFVNLPSQDEAIKQLILIDATEVLGFSRKLKE